MKYKNTILCTLCALCAFGTYTQTNALFSWFGSYIQNQAKEGAKKGLVEGVPEAAEITVKKIILIATGFYFMKPLAQKIVNTPNILKGSSDPILKALFGGFLWMMASNIGNEKKQTFRQKFKNKFSTIYNYLNKKTEISVSTIYSYFNKKKKISVSTIYNYLNKKKKISVSNQQQNNSSPFDPTDDL